MFFEGFEVFRFIPPGQQAAVNGGVESFNPPVQYFRKPGNLGDRPGGYAGLIQGNFGISGRKSFPTRQ